MLQLSLGVVIAPLLLTTVIMPVVAAVNVAVAIAVYLFVVSA